VTAFIEITPFDLIKYEVDKPSGYLKVDRPQRTSALPPTLYGFVPRTYCAARVSALMPGTTRGDGDPLDICVVSERPIQRSGVILEARVIGGLPMRDAGEADDKIVAVLSRDPVWSEVAELADLPAAFVGRLRHYFETYKLLPGDEDRVVLGESYGREHALAVVRAAMADYEQEFGAES
jgi:inorganic pyrophosphatase